MGNRSGLGQAQARWKGLSDNFKPDLLTGWVCGSPTVLRRGLERSEEGGAHVHLYITNPQGIHYHFE